MAEHIELGSGSLKGSSWFGRQSDSTYDVPDGAIHVGIDHKDLSSKNLTIGRGNGNVRYNWDKQAGKVCVHAWVNGAFGHPNEVKWEVFAL